MKRIPSFSIDHTRLKRGVYPSRQDDDVMTWDVRMKEPNHGDYLSTGVSHTIEHLFATYARNSEWKDGIIYIGPMGCRTGCYFLTRGLTNAEVLDCVLKSVGRNLAATGQQTGVIDERCDGAVEFAQAAHKVIDQFKGVEVQLQAGDILVAGNIA